MVEPTTVEQGAFTVVGRHYQGTNEEGGIAELWQNLESAETDLETLRSEPGYFGVSYGGDPETGEFEYLAGVRADQGTEVPDGFSAVDVPAATYLQFETTLADIEQTMAEVHREWLPASDFELAMGPEFERYPADFDRGDPSSTFEVFVPVETPTD